jgi:glycosyltransferase involved in cell wall biosynthesis
MSFLLVAFAGLLALPVFLFCIEILAAVTLPQRGRLSPLNGRRERLAVLVPAHNEGSGIQETLDDIRAQLHPHDRLLVVADNCTDNTVAIAKATGAEVTERHNLTKVGKGYALDWGVRHLSDDPSKIVVVIDADCRLTNGTLDRLALACLTTGRPAQALYLIAAPPQSPINYQVAEFAFRVKNWARPLGLRALNLPCQLMGTGMAFPWELIISADLATEAAVEDLKIGLDLARAGHPPLFCPLAGVNSQFPMTIKGAKTQRERWELGHLRMIATSIAKLLYESLTKRDFRLLALTLDMAIPPLTLLATLLGLMLLISALGVLLGFSSVGLIISAASLSAFMFGILLCWLRFGRDILPLSSMPSVFHYVVDKLPLYRQFLSHGGTSQWVRTDRDKIDNH